MSMIIALKTTVDGVSKIAIAGESKIVEFTDKGKISRSTNSAIKVVPVAPNIIIGFVTNNYFKVIGILAKIKKSLELKNSNGNCYYTEDTYLIIEKIKKHLFTLKDPIDDTDLLMGLIDFKSRRKRLYKILLLNKQVTEIIDNGIYTIGCTAKDRAKIAKEYNINVKQVVYKDNSIQDYKVLIHAMLDTFGENLDISDTTGGIISCYESEDSGWCPVNHGDGFMINEHNGSISIEEFRKVMNMYHDGKWFKEVDGKKILELETNPIKIHENLKYNKH